MTGTVNKSNTQSQLNVKGSMPSSEKHDYDNIKASSYYSCNAGVIVFAIYMCVSADRNHWFRKFK